MDDAAAGGHDLNFAGVDDSLVAEVVAVLDGAIENVGDDLHLLVRMAGEALAGLDGVVVEDAQGAPVHILRIVIVTEREVPIGCEPAVIGEMALIGFDDLHHGNLRSFHWRDNRC